MKCKNCGYNNSIENNFCDFCGELLDHVPPPAVISDETVTINKNKYRLYREDGQTVDNFILSTMEKLLQTNSILKSEIKNLLDKEYCKQTFDLQYPLLVENNSKCYGNKGLRLHCDGDKIAGYYINRKWSRKKFETYDIKFAMWLKQAAKKIANFGKYKVLIYYIGKSLQNILLDFVCKYWEIPDFIVGVDENKIISIVVQPDEKCWRNISSFPELSYASNGSYIYDQPLEKKFKGKQLPSCIELDISHPLYFYKGKVWAWDSYELLEFGYAEKESSSDSETSTNGIKVNLQDKEGKTALLIASSKNSPKIVKFLIDAGADVNLKDDSGFTALMSASMYNYTEVAKLLIDAGADVNLQDNDGWTAIRYAARYNSLEAVKQLIDAGATMSLQDRNKLSTYLIDAAKNNSLEKAKLLINVGVNLNVQNNDGWSALMFASWNNYPEIIKLLIDAGADVNMQDNNGQTAIMLASWKSYPETVKLLIDAGADVNLKDNSGYTALILASRKDTGYTEIVKLLIDAGANLNVQNNDGWSALMLASENNYPEIIKLLIDAGVDVNARKKDGKTALLIASSKNYPEIVNILRDADLKKNVTHNGNSRVISRKYPGAIEKFHAAVKYGNIVKVKQYINDGIDVNLQDNHGWTALMYAASYNLPEIAKLLIDAGADVNLKDEWGQTALKIATWKKHNEICNIIGKKYT